MNLKDLISNKLFHVDVNVYTKDDALRHMARALQRDGRVNDVEEFLKSVYEREEIESTNFDIGIAIPHSNSPVIQKSSVSFLRPINELDWEDGKLPVKAMFLIAVSPKDEGISHLEAISSLAGLLLEEDFIELVYTTKNVNEIIKAIEIEMEEEL